VSKLRLDIDTLAVDSFEPARALDLRATVQARQVTPEPDCQYSYDYGNPCNTLDPMSGCDTCAETCAHTCARTCGNTCPASCAYTCGFTCTVPDTDPLVCLD
jgi:hypothetical protein